MLLANQIIVILCAKNYKHKFKVVVIQEKV